VKRPRGGLRKARTGEPYRNTGDAEQKRANSDHLHQPCSLLPDDQWMSWEALD